MDKPSYLAIQWPDKPENVSAMTTLINGGFSKGNFSEFNLASHVGDDAGDVAENRSKLVNELQLPSEPVWLDQVHSNKVIYADQTVATAQADASISSTRGVVCAVLTADCLPVFICDNNGSEIAVAHAGWRGLHAGIITNTVGMMQAGVANIQVYLGAAIGPENFEVGEEVFQAFVSKNELNKTAFTATKKGHYLCDIYQLARIELRSLGVDKVSGGDACTYAESQKYYSYRRQQITGRMASLIWLL